jgi:hypothetical protein
LNRFVSTFVPALLALPVLIAAGCSNSSGGDAPPGSASVVLTDSASDDLSQFELDVSNIVLTRFDGTRVSVLPRAAHVDFVQLQSLAELIAAVDLPSGVYTGLTMTLDFTNAVVVIAGQTTPATVRDATGNPITGPIDVTVDFAPGARIAIRASRNNLFALDLDLDQSTAIDPIANVVTFVPVLGVEVDPSNPKPISTTGILHSVDTMASTFEVERRDAGNAVVTMFTAATNNATVFQLDGVVERGAPGLGSLIAHIGQRVFVQGTVDVGTPRLHAAAVESGAGVPGNGQDWVFGHVVARTGGAGTDAVLTVLGRSFDVGTNTRIYNTAHTVNVSHANSKVLRRGAGNALDTDDIGIGQLVWVFGDLTGTTLDATATTGVARLLRTAIAGTVVSAPANNTLTLDVARFDHRPVSAFNFTVSGQVQADPTAFPIDVTGLSTTGIGVGSHVRAIGWIAAIDSTGPEATAEAIVDRTDGGKVLFCLWVPSSATALTVDATTVSITGVADALVKLVGDGIAPITLTPSPTPTVQALGTTGFYRIVQGHHLTAYGTFASFRTALATRLSTANVFALSGVGTFEAAPQVFSARGATVVLD